ncbi:hypothetical protein DBR42_28865 [Pelomonas sp. HMWF004]|nr:hypothetical protein DBR42_28865 [Pelomonas sp. HMWF004]
MPAQRALVALALAGLGLGLALLAGARHALTAQGQQRGLRVALDAQFVLQRGQSPLQFGFTRDKRCLDGGLLCVLGPVAQALHLGQDNGVLAAGGNAGHQLRAGGHALRHERPSASPEKVSAVRFSSKSLEGLRDGGCPLDAGRHP